MVIADRHSKLQARQLAIHCVVPVHNEEETITDFLTTLHAKLSGLTEHFQIIIIDDGSTDQTLAKAQTFLNQPEFRILSFSRNFGKEAALTAGLAHADGDVCIMIDADFQHPLDTIDEFLAKWCDGIDMVYGVRATRDDESWLKRIFSRIFYRLMTSITKVKIPAHAGDFRLLDRCVVKAMNQLPERERFMKGLYAWVGFKTAEVLFTVQERKAGTSSWRFRHLFELAMVGITSFSSIPLRVWSFVGFIVSVFAFIYGTIIVFDTLSTGIDVPGYATTVVAIMFFGGIQLLSIGILGEYIARIFSEVKQRPPYIVAKKLGYGDE